MASTATFESLGLDYRVLRSIEKRKLSSPTNVQVAVIGKALEGKDIVARAHTGSGKTLAYLAPAIHAVLQQDDVSAPFQVIVLVPTSELCEQVRTCLDCCHATVSEPALDALNTSAHQALCRCQVRKEATSIAVHCGANLRTTVLAADAKQKAKHISVSSSGQIVVTTPGRLAAVLKDQTLSPAALTAHLKVCTILFHFVLLLRFPDQFIQSLPLLHISCNRLYLCSARDSLSADHFRAQ